MPEKKELYRSYGEKLISLFSRLLYSGESYSLPDLASTLGCSKQSVIRLIGDLNRAYHVDIEESFRGNKKYYKLRKPLAGAPTLPLSEMDMNILSMCQAFAKHLMGDRLFEEATQALLKSRALVAEAKGASPVHFGSFRPGSIDYTAHQGNLQKLIKAMGEKRICKIVYRAMWDGKAKSYYVKPLKIFSHKDTVYLHARKVRAPGQKFKEADYDPLLAVHRIGSVDITDRQFEFPSDYNFEKLFNKEFGVIKDEPFRATVEFQGWAARFVSERTWSPDQKLLKRKDGSIRLTFTTSSEAEFISWVLSFREEAKVLRPKWLVDTVKQTLDATTRLYA